MTMAIRLMLWKGATSRAYGSPPWWMGVLQMAESWGVPPWEITDHSGSLVWAARWAAYRKEVAWVQDEQSKKK